jgi:hypothetical protein
MLLCWPGGRLTWLHAAHHLRVHLLHLLLECCRICCTASLPPLPWRCLLLLLHHELLPHHLLHFLLLVLQMRQQRGDGSAHGIISTTGACTLTDSGSSLIG